MRGEEYVLDLSGLRAQLLPANFISHFVIGLILGLVRTRSRSLYPGMIIHTLWNAIVISGEIFV